MTEINQPSGDDSQQDGARQGDPQWPSCPQGSIKQVMRNVKSQQLRSRMSKVVGGSASVLALLLLVLSIGYWSVAGDAAGPGPAPQPNSTVVRRISCGQVIKQLEDYLAGKVDHDMELRIDRHMRKCRRCHDRIPHDHPKAHLVAARDLLSSPLNFA